MERVFPVLVVDEAAKLVEESPLFLAPPERELLVYFLKLCKEKSDAALQRWRDAR
jgi:hypothetical protein